MASPLVAKRKQVSVVTSEHLPAEFVGSVTNRVDVCKQFHGQPKWPKWKWSFCVHCLYALCCKPEWCCLLEMQSVCSSEPSAFQKQCFVIMHHKMCVFDDAQKRCPICLDDGTSWENCPLRHLQSTGDRRCHTEENTDREAKSMQGQRKTRGTSRTKAESHNSEHDTNVEQETLWALIYAHIFVIVQQQNRTISSIS